MSLSIVMPCYVHIATSLSIVASQWMSLAMSLSIVVPQWGICSSVMSHCDVIMSHGKIKVVRTGVISTKRSEHRGDLHQRSRIWRSNENKPQYIHHWVSIICILITKQNHSDFKGKSRTCIFVGQIYWLVFGSSLDMWLVLTSVDGRISHTSIIRLHIYLGSHTALLALVRATLHLIPHIQVLLDH